MSVQQMPTGTVTFLMTDIEGSTRMWEDHADVMDAVLARHEELIGATVAAHGGHRPLEQGEGDSAVASFWRAADAVDAAIALQRALADDAWPDGAAPAVRMAIHTGEASVRPDGTYRGVALHRCARIRGLAHGGQVLLGESSVRLTVDELPPGSSVRDLGQHRLRDLTRPERLFQLEAPGLCADFPPLRSLDAVEHNLPVQMTTFVGRTRELGELALLLDSSRMVTLVGAGGCGKTRLAVQAAAERAEIVDAVWFVELARVTDEQGVRSQVLRAAGLKEDLTRSLPDVVAARLGESSVLVVLDNCEHVIDASTAVVEELFGGVGALAVVATSREPLGAAGEVVCRVPSLAVPADEAPPGAAEDSEAVQLLVDRCRLVRPGFEPDESDLEHLASICRRLDGIPLAIELAAARTRVLSPAEVARGLDDRFRLLAGGGRTSLPRQQTLRASVDWSYALLDDEERTVLRRLAVFSGGFTLEGAEVVVSGAPGGSSAIDRYAVLDLITRLVDKSLLIVEAEREPARFRLLETIRQYAEERLIDSGEAQAVRDAHAACYADLAHQAAPGLDGPALESWVQRLAPEHANLLDAVAWLVDRSEAVAAWTMVGDLTFCWASLGNFTDARRAFEQCLGQATEVDPTIQLPARWGAAHLAFYAGDFLTGVERATDALARAEAVGDQRHIARSLSTLGTIEMTIEPSVALEKSVSASLLAEQVGDLWCATDAGQIAAYIHLVCNRLDDTIEWLDRTAPGARTLDNAQLLAWDLGGRGTVALLRGDLGLAGELLDAAIRQGRRTGDPNIIGHNVAWRCLGLAAAGDPSAVSLTEEALAQARRDGAGLAEMALEVAVTHVRALSGDLDRADEVFRSGIDLLEAFVPVTGVRLLIIGAGVAIARGDLPEARARVDRGRALAPATMVADRAVFDRQAAMIEVDLAAAAGWPATADLSGAEQLAHQALEAADHHGLAIDRLDALDVLAVIAGRRGQAVEAARIWAARDAEAARLGLVATQATPWAEGHRIDIMSTVDAEMASVAAAEGGSLEVAAVVAYVRRARGERRRPTFGWESLTPTESQVVELAASGLSNRLIGERLFITAGTVKVHLGHVYAKLGVANRTELAAARGQRSIPVPGRDN